MPSDMDEKRKNSDEIWRNRKATPQRLVDMFQQYQLEDEVAWGRAQTLAGVIPTRNDWLRYVDIVLTGLGTIFLLAGAVFFFAFNWDDLSNFQRFAIVEGAVIIATVLAFILNIDKWAGKLALAGACILLGVALAVVGQTYQTGANSYRLFMIWTMFITGWVLIGRWNILYLIWMVLLNVTITLYWEQVVYDDWLMLNVILLLINVGFVFGWEIIGRIIQWEFMVKERWFLYLLMLVAIGHATVLMIDVIFDSTLTQQPSTLPVLLYVGLIGGVCGYFSVIRRDLLMITMSAFSVLIIIIAGSGRLLSELGDGGDPFFFFLIMTIITVSATSVMTLGLRSLSQQWGDDNE